MYEEASNRMATYLNECKEDYHQSFERLIHKAKQVVEQAVHLSTNDYPKYKTVILSDGSEDGTEQYLSHLIQELNIAEGNVRTRRALYYQAKHMHELVTSQPCND